MKKTLLWFLVVAGLAMLMIVTISPRKPYYILRDVGAFFSLSSVIEENELLRQKNAHLLAQVFAPSYNDSRSPHVFADVFSFYPLNVKHTLVIDAGTEQGVVEGDGVLFGDGVMVGFVDRVEKNASRVVSIYNPSFSLSVHVGDAKIDGLLEGGLIPRITLIDKRATLVDGDIIVSASPKFPYGTVIGFVDGVEEDISGGFFEARIQVPYTLSDIKEVSIITDYHAPSF